MTTVVFDTSTLILLAKIDLLHLITRHVRTLIPLEVQQESLRKPDLLDARHIQRLIDDNAIQVSSQRERRLARQLEEDFHLGRGEAACIALARRYRWTVASDDAQAIKTCQAIGLPFVTALLFLVRSYEKKFIGQEMALAKLEKLQRYGWYDLGLLTRVSLQIGGR